MGRAASPSATSALALLLALVPPPEAVRAEQLPEEPPMLGPRFTEEPPWQVPYAVDAGVRLRCGAEGTPPPRVTWLLDSGERLPELRGLRRVYDNGTLEILPSSGADAAAVTLRCRAANAHGVALSRDITLDPVAEEEWEARAEAPTAAEGGVAVITCGATNGVAVAVRTWFRGERAIPPPGAATIESRYVFAGDSLLIRAVRGDDAGAYGCEAQHRRTGRRRRSPPATLVVAAGAASDAAPAERGAGDETLEADAGERVCLPCAAPLRPPTAYTWVRELDGRQRPAPGERWAGGAALCVRAERALEGAWLCRASAAAGDRTRRLRLRVREPLAVAVRPAQMRADAGAAVLFSCSASDERASLAWLHDGAPAGAGPALRLRASRAARGVYQCVARRGAESAQAAAELRLGEFAPELQYAFIERALRAGGDVSLRCVASGSPPPRLSWLRDGRPLEPEPRRFRAMQAASGADAVAAELNISAVAAADGGRYSCRADNRRGRAEHSARLNVYGPPAVRALGPVRVVAGANATVYCPYAGYPISSVWWRRVGAPPLAETGRLSARGAELRLRPAMAADAGRYSCTVEAPGGDRASADLELQIRNPPKISPFVFSSELTEGSTVQVLCGVSSGDRPIYFSWTKDGAPLPVDLQIEEKNLNEFSLLMFPALTALHTGAYTCRASNHAAAAEYTASLAVKVPPAWTARPADAALLAGERLEVRCAARGQPAPRPLWERPFGPQGSVRSAAGTMDASGESDEPWEPVPETNVADGALRVEAVSRAHAGLYRCRVDNGVPPPLLQLINVTVYEPAHVDASSGNVTSVRGTGAALECQSRGDAPLAVQWTHRGDQLDLDSHRWTVAEVRTADGLRSTLRLRASERADAGEYRCRAHNRFGASEALIYLRVEEPPDAPQELRLGGMGSRWVRLRWRSTPAALLFSASCEALVPSEPHEPHLLELVPENTGDARVDGDGLRTYSAKLENLKPAVSYSLRVIATNSVGRSPHSEPLLVTTLEEAPTAAPQNMRVQEGPTSELHVSWSAPPRDSWNGDLLGFALTWREAERFDGRCADRADESVDADENLCTGMAVAPGLDGADLIVAALRPFTRYALRLRAFNRAGAGPASADVLATTTDGDAAPRGLSCEGVSPHALRVSWSPAAATGASAPGIFQLHYAAVQLDSAWSTTEAACCSATLRGLAAGANHSVWLRALPAAGREPPGAASAPLYCATPQDAPGPVETIGALASGPDAVRVTWLPPAGGGRPQTHFTLHTRELGKTGAAGERAQRVAAAADAAEPWAEVRGLRAGAAYEFRVRAADARGSGPPGRPATAAPPPRDLLLAARVSSLTRELRVPLGGRARLPCAAVGSPPLRRHWSPPRPLPPGAYALSDDGAFVVHSADAASAGEYACHVRNAAGADAVRVLLAVLMPPEPPRPRLSRVAPRALLVAWDAPVAPAPGSGASLPLGYTLSWRREGAAGPRRSASVAPGAASRWLRGLACGASYRVWLRAHAAFGDSAPADAVRFRTPGHRASAPPANRFFWANETALRLNLLAWMARDACPVTAWRLALRPQAAEPGAAVARRELAADAQFVEFADLRPSTWYEIRVEASSAAGDSTAVYRAATLTRGGERLGDAIDVTDEKLQSGAADDAGGEGAESGPWRPQLAPALAAGALASLLAVLTGAVLLRRRVALERRAAPSPPPPPYGGSGKVCALADDELRDISPYATFSMGGAGDAERAVRLRTCGGADAAALAAAPRPCGSLGAHSHARDSDSESSGSPCAACAAELYRLPAAHLSDTLPAAESSADDTSCSAGSRAGGARHGAPPSGARPRRRRDAAPLHWQPTLRSRRGPP